MSVSCSLSQNGSERFQKENRTELPYWKSGTFFYFGHYRTWNESSIEANSVSDHSSGHYFTTLSCICPLKMKCLSEWIVSGKIRRCSVFENKMFDWMIWRSFLYINLIEPLQGLFNQHYFERKSGGLPLVFMPSPSWGRAVIIAVSCSLHSPCFFQLLSLSLSLAGHSDSGSLGHVPLLWRLFPHVGTLLSQLCANDRKPSVATTPGPSFSPTAVPPTGDMLIQVVDSEGTLICCQVLLPLTETSIVEVSSLVWALACASQNGS